MSGKQCRPWSDAAFCGVWSWSTLFAQACLSDTRSPYGNLIKSTPISPTPPPQISSWTRYCTGYSYIWKSKPIHLMPSIWPKLDLQQWSGFSQSPTMVRFLTRQLIHHTGAYKLQTTWGGGGGGVGEGEQRVQYVGKKIFVWYHFRYLDLWSYLHCPRMFAFLKTRQKNT